MQTQTNSGEKTMNTLKVFGSVPFDIILKAVDVYIESECEEECEYLIVPIDERHSNLYGAYLQSGHVIDMLRVMQTMDKENCELYQRKINVVYRYYVEWCCDCHKDFEVADSEENDDEFCEVMDIQYNGDYVWYVDRIGLSGGEIGLEAFNYFAMVYHDMMSIDPENISEEEEEIMFQATKAHIESLIIGEIQRNTTKK